MLPIRVKLKDVVDAVTIFEYRKYKNVSSDARSKDFTTYSLIKKEQMSTFSDFFSSTTTVNNASSQTALEDRLQVIYSLVLSLAFDFFLSLIAKY